MQDVPLLTVCFSLRIEHAPTTARARARRHKKRYRCAASFRSMAVFCNPIVVFNNSIVVFNNSIVVFDNSIVVFDNSIVVFDNSIVVFDNSIVVFNNSIVVFDNSIVVFDNSIVVFCNPIIVFDNSVVFLDHGTSVRHISITARARLARRRQRINRACKGAGRRRLPRAYRGFLKRFFSQPTILIVCCSSFVSS